MTTTTADLRTIDQIRAGIRHRAAAMTDERIARKAQAAKDYVVKLANDPDIAARIEAVERAVEWGLIADERAGRRAAA